MTSKNRNTLGTFIGAVGAFFVSFACFGTALVGRDGQGIEAFRPWILLLAVVAFAASVIVAGHRLHLILVLSVAYAVIPLWLELAGGLWPRLHLYCALAAVAGIATGKLLVFCTSRR